MGPFFWDLVDDEVEAGQLYMLLREELKKAPSKAVYEDEIGTVPFSGYGDCPYWVKPGDFDEASSSKSPMLLLLFLAKAVRMQCILPTEQDVVKDLISEKLMYWVSTKAHALKYEIIKYKHWFSRWLPLGPQKRRRVFQHHTQADVTLKIVEF